MGYKFYLGNVMNILKNKNIYVIRNENMTYDLQHIGTWLNDSRPMIFDGKKVRSDYELHNSTHNCTDYQISKFKSFLSFEYKIYNNILSWSVNG
jgi:hypothetical protein